MKTLTLLIPVYNTQDYLRRCLDSVLTEKSTECLEVIAVNDGSSDASLDILREYQQRFPETVVLIDKENGGHGSAVNAGLRAACGRYFRVLDSDDWFDTPAFYQFLQQLNECDEDLIVTPYTQEYAYDGQELAYSYEKLEHNRVYTGDDIEPHGSSGYFCLASATYKTELLHACGLHLYENCCYVDMQYALFPYSFVQSMRYLQYPVYRYFIGRPEQSVNGESLIRNLAQHQRVLVSLIEFYTGICNQLEPKRREYMSTVICLMYYTHLSLIRQLKKRRLAYRTLSSLEKLLLQKAPELYEKASSFSFLRWSRKLRYQNLLVCPGILDLLTKAAGRLRAVRGQL